MLHLNPDYRYDRIGGQWLVLDAHDGEVVVLDGPAAQVMDRVQAGAQPLSGDLAQAAEVLVAHHIVLRNGDSRPGVTRRRTLQLGLAAAAGMTVLGLPSAASATSVLSGFAFGGVQTPAGGATGDPVVVGGVAYHVFTAASADLTSRLGASPANPFVFDCFIVAGGGGGGGSVAGNAGAGAVGAGGGGAGAVLATTGTLTSMTPASVLVGGGGPGGASSATASVGTQGTSSAILGLTVDRTAVGGGAGGGRTTLTGGNGGSGGGGAGVDGAGPPGSGAGGTGAFDGGQGRGNNNANLSGGGGGGSTASGADAGVSSAGNGGAGTALSTFVPAAAQTALNAAGVLGLTLPSSVGGGGGGGCTSPGTAVDGGGQGGTTSTSPAAGTIRTGGGGGGGRSTAGGAGGSGIIIVKYAV